MQKTNKVISLSTLGAIFTFSTALVFFTASQVHAGVGEWKHRLTWPVHGKITAHFGSSNRFFGMHPGIDIAAVQGMPVQAAADGKVIHVKKPKGHWASYIVIRHGNTFTTSYIHLSAVHVHKGQMVKAGDIIGLIGGQPGTLGAGKSTGPHLHFEVRKQRIPVPPKRFLKTQQ